MRSSDREGVAAPWAFRGSGEMAHLMRQLDWSGTPVGPVESWPASLRTAVSICLTSRFPIELWWGPQYVRFYNDAYRPILGANKHPQFLGRPGRECWGEVWDVIGPMLDGVRATGEATWSEDMPLLLNRNGYVEQTFFTFSYSPVFGETGTVEGIFCACTETTSRVLGERRLHTLRELGERSVAPATTAEACAFMIEVLSRNPTDIPFALLYRREGTAGPLQLVAASGLPEESPARPATASLDARDARSWSFAAARKSGALEIERDLAARFGPVQAGGHPEPVSQAVVIPLSYAGAASSDTFLVVGLNPRCPLDDAYLAFFRLVGNHVRSAIGNAETRGKLEEERQRLHRFLLHAPAAICITRGPDHVYEFSNLENQRLLGDREVVGKSLRELVRESELPGAYHAFDQVFRTGEPWAVQGYEVGLGGRGGQAAGRYFDWMLSALRDAEGRVEGVVSFASEVTGQVVARKHAEEARAGLQVAEERLRLALAAAAVGTWDLDLSTGVASWDPVCKQMFGLPPDAEVDAALLEGLLHADDRDTVRALFDQARAGALGMSYRLEFRTVGRADGLTRWIETNGRIFLDARGKGARIIGTARDLTESKRAEEERSRLLEREQALRQEAQAAGRAKDEFLAMLGHELRNPLSPILTALQVMRLRGDEAASRERAVIERQVGHLVGLVDDLLDVSRITRGKIELRRRPVDVAEVLAAGIEIASPLLESKHHTLLLDAPRGVLVVDGDPGRLAQVVSNLVANAAKYTDPGGHVGVSVRRDGPDVVLSVRDDGMGMPAELLPRIFDLFEQGARAFDRAQGGLGLGLAIVRSIVALHGGTVSASSAGPGRGSTFIVRLPASSDQATSTKPPPPLRAQPATANPKRVLVVDDNEDAAELLQYALQAQGFEVHVAHDGPSALALAQQNPPDLAILDLGLPVMDGYELARRLRSLPRGPALGLFALTGYGQETDRQRSAAAGFDEHLVKPLDLSVLEDRMTAFLRGEGRR